MYKILKGTTFLKVIFFLSSERNQVATSKIVNYYYL